MLGWRDTWTLATTKLRVRRVRLVVTLIVAGVLFTVLIFGSLVIRGVAHSLTSFVGEGLLNSFITTIFDTKVGGFEIYQDKAFIARVEQLEKARLDAQVAEAKRVGLPFDPKAAPKATMEFDGQNGKQKGVDNTHPAARQALPEFTPDTLQAKVEAAAQGYNPKAFHQSFRFSAGASPEIEFTPIVKGQEQLLTDRSAAYGLRDSLGSFHNDLIAYDDALLKPFLLEGTNLEVRADGAIPILAPIDAVEKLVGLESLSRKAKPEERVVRLKEVRGRAKDLIFEACYRNKTAMDLRNAAKQQAEEIKLRSAEPGYVKPTVVYGAPSSPCQPMPISSDSRTAAEKALAEKQAAFDEKFGTPRPVTSRMKFRIVGVMPQLGSLYTAQGPEALVTSFFTSSLGEGWFISRQAALASPAIGRILVDPYFIANGAKSVFVEFNDRESQRKFIDEQGCDMRSQESYENCGKNGKFFATPFGNPLATLHDAADETDKFFKILLGVIAALSAIVMMGTIGKIIADSRKETSVFRAVGAKRSDIAQVYLLYTAILATMSYFVAIGIGLAAALWVEANYSPSLSVQAVLAFNSQDLDKTFHLIGFSPRDLGLIYVFVLAVSLASALIPLAGNIRRNPVGDMRED